MTYCEVGLIAGYSVCTEPAVDSIVHVDDDIYNVCAKHLKDFQ